MQWIPTRTRSDSSLLLGLAKPKDIVRKSIQCGYPGAVLSDIGSISGTLEFVTASKTSCANCGHQQDAHNDSGQCLLKGVTCKGFEKSTFKPIFGCEFHLCPEDPKVHAPTNLSCATATVISKNLGGWKKLISSVSCSYRPEHFYKKPRLDLNTLAGIVGGKDAFVSTGYVGSDLSAALFTDAKAAYFAKSLDEVRGFVRDDWKKSAKDVASRYVDLFGRENVLVSIQLVDHASSPVAVATAKCLRVIAKEMGLKRIASSNSFYADKSDAVDQRILISSKLDGSLEKVKDEASKHEDYWLSSFFRGNDKHIPELTEVESLYEPDEIKAAIEVFEACETYSIESRPLLPDFSGPNLESPTHYIRKLCNRGMTEKLGKHPGAEAIARLGRETDVLSRADLNGYFGIIWDVCKFANRNNIPLGRGRGSAAGCFTSFLLEITRIEPISHSLLFERFYNDGRNSKSHTSMPDIDVDVAKGRREEVISYIRSTYGDDKVAHMATFQRYQGRGCLKDIFRAVGRLGFEEMNEITKWVPDAAKISGELQEQKESEGESSIIRWALENNSKKLKQWAVMDADGRVSGPLGTMFEQAIRLEGTKRSMGKHASGIVVSNTPLADICPMVMDKSGHAMTGFDMSGAEKVGLVKLDILGIAILDKIQGVCDLLEFGEMRKVS